MLIDAQEYLISFCSISITRPYSHTEFVLHYEFLILVTRLLTLILELLRSLVSHSVVHSLLHMSVCDPASPPLLVSHSHRVASLVFALSVLLSLPQGSLVNTDVRSQIIKQPPKKKKNHWVDSTPSEPSSAEDGKVTEC